MTVNTNGERRDLDYSDVEADADRMMLVQEMRELGHTDKCINDGRPGDEPTDGCTGCEPEAIGWARSAGRVTGRGTAAVESLITDGLIERAS